ncbi:hypothetical protein BDV37DRAFT_239994 [Aspergillus pseudonomiae]|uniref:Uncharacterized protein n=1 Tax=Aspergillus pseudonomiae TaxID=1506151 RepID=A0A5N7DMN2_9EURO|nr:uncharacterized protein BDV37DRAFT_239994 [Aspergillus pseudonomiae]KAE8407717.1 hypothetical protein BDV37DRAFT_239994 [Aspergillus pseudonomiae]
MKGKMEESCWRNRKRKRKRVRGCKDNKQKSEYNKMFLGRYTPSMSCLVGTTTMYFLVLTNRRVSEEQ